MKLPCPRSDRAEEYVSKLTLRCYITTHHLEDEGDKEKDENLLQKE